MNQLAKATGPSVQHVQKYEAGHNRLTASRLAELADPSSTAFEAREAPGVSAGTFYRCFNGGRAKLQALVPDKTRNRGPFGLSLQIWAQVI